MDTLRTVLPGVGLLIGVAIGWFWGTATLPAPAPAAAVQAHTCPPSPITPEVRGLELEVSLLKRELEEGW